MATLLKIVGGALVVAISFFVTLFMLVRVSPPSANSAAPKLVEIPPLPPVTRSSLVIAPVSVALSAIRDALDAAAPRNLAGKDKNPLSEILSKADIGWTLTRSPLALAGRPEGLAVSTTLNGSLRVTGQIGTQAANIGGNITGLLNEGLGRNVQNIAGRALDQRADIRGNVALTARPTITPQWRLEPNMTAQIKLADAALSVAGVKLSMSKEIKPLLDRAVDEQIAALQTRLRNDPAIEQAARREWAKLCRSMPLGAAGAGAPNLWLEMRPTRAFAAQPRIDANAVTFTIGVQAETRILPAESKPNCPFPQKLDIVAQAQQSKVAIGLPIDLPFSEVNRLMESQLKGRNFPEDGSGPVAVTVESASVAASGDRLLISLRVKAREQKSWFGLGTEALVHVWGRPALDREQQILRFTDLSLAVESEAAFGLLGAAARAAMPYLQAALERNAVVDLKPLAASARKSIEAALADFRAQGDGVRVDAAVTALRLAGIEFDAKTLRITAEADGELRATVTQSPKQ